MNKQASSLITAILLVLCITGYGVAAQRQPSAKHPYASETPINEPTVFAQGVISTGDFDSHPAFTPDGKTLYFVRNEYSPTISPDKRYFFWTSARSFADTPLKKRLSTQELMSKLRSPGNGLGDVYYIDITALAIENRDK